MGLLCSIEVNYQHILVGFVWIYVDIYIGTPMTQESSRSVKFSLLHLGRFRYILEVITRYFKDVSIIYQIYLNWIKVG